MSALEAHLSRPVHADHALFRGLTCGCFQSERLLPQMLVINIEGRCQRFEAGESLAERHAVLWELLHRQANNDVCKLDKQSLWPLACV